MIGCAAMLDIDADVDMETFLRMEEELMAEAELEHLQREAELAMGWRQCDGALKPFFPEAENAVNASSSSSSTASFPACGSRHRGAGGAGSDGEGAGDTCSNVAFTCSAAVTGGDSSAAAMSPLRVVATGDVSAPCTPPSRKCAAAPSTPPKRKRHLESAATDVQQASSCGNVLLPIQGAQVSSGSSPASDARVSNEPPALLSPLKRARIVGKGGDVTTVPELRNVAAAEGELLSPPGQREFPIFWERCSGLMSAFGKSYGPTSSTGTFATRCKVHGFAG